MPASLLAPDTLGNDWPGRFNARMTLAFDPPPAGDSPLRRLDPRWKLVALGPAMLAVSFVHSLTIACTALAGAAVLAFVALLPVRWLARRFGALAVALGPIIVLLPLVQGVEGVRVAALLAAKGMAVVLLVLVLLGTAPVPTTVHAAQALGLHGILVQIVLLSYRYLFVLADEFDRLRRALRSRGFRAGTNRHTYRTAGHVVGTLLVRSAERAEGVAHAMRCRGFDGRFRSLCDFRTRTRDVVFFSVALVAAAALVVWDVWS
jgi:cobalt/nickel transport system permease protein